MTKSYVYQACVVSTYAITLIVLLSIYGKTQIEYGPHSERAVGAISIVPVVCDLIVCIGLLVYYAMSRTQEIKQCPRQAHGNLEQLIAIEQIPSFEPAADQTPRRNREFNASCAYSLVLLISWICTLIVIIYKIRYGHLFDIATPLYIVVLIHACIYILFFTILVLTCLCTIIYGIVVCTCACFCPS